MPIKLNVLSEYEKALETCGYCPKLCRAKCPVSDAIPRDSLTPWGKMTMAWLAQRGDVPEQLPYTDVVWGCSGCYACKTACEHKNPVVPSLLRAREKAQGRGGAPAGVERLIQRHTRRADVIRRRVLRVASDLSLPASASTALVIGCGYWLYEPELARQLTAAVRRLVGDFMLSPECCGAVLENAGDGPLATVQRRRFDLGLAGAERVLVYDPGCAISLTGYPMRTVIDVAAERLDSLTAAPVEFAARGPLRYHDPCQLGRGLGQYEQPRALLERLTGQRPREFRHNREQALCSGGGAVLPQSYPEAASSIATRRVREHLASGGGTLVTACSSSLRQFRRAGADVVDLASLLSRGVLAR